MKTLRLFFLSLFSCFILKIQAQENKTLDSILQAYQKQPNDTTKVFLGNLLCKELTYTSPQEAYRYANEMVSISKELDYKQGMAMGNYALGLYFRNRHQIDSAEYSFKKSLQFYTENNDIRGAMSNNTQLADLNIQKTDYVQAMSYLDQNIELYDNRAFLPNVKKSDFKYIGSTYHTISTVYYNKGLLQLSLKHQLRALKLYKKYAEEIYVADALNGLGTLESDLGNTAQAIRYYEQALKIYQKLGDVNFTCLTLENLGNSLKTLGRHTEAFDSYFKALKISKENKYSLSEATIHNGLGRNYLAVDDTKNALKHFEQSLQLFKEMKYPAAIQYTYSGFGEFYYKTNDPESSVFYFTKGIVIADSTQSIKSALHLYKKRSESFQEIGKYKEGLDDYMMYSALKDSVFNETKSQQIEELRIIYDTEKKEQEIALLEQKAEISNLQKLLLRLGLGLSLFIFGLGYYALRQKMKRNKLEKEHVDAQLAFKKKELTTQALLLAKKNETLESLKQKAEEIKSAKDKKGISQLVNTINFDLQDDNNWENFARYFEEVHRDFNTTIKSKFPDVSSNELRLMALLKMNLSTKEIANILNISHEGVRKAYYRLRKKLGLTPDESLRDFVITL
ncbi:tetratricopeptide repeat protein [Flagellimonas allohymeniacidonis]|nr:tetratricopeptide repeat protein [Allomuricauda hymeniacidonis]